jgi:hypothetical protein
MKRRLSKPSRPTTTAPEDQAPGPAPAPRSWLDGLPAHRRGVLCNWFHFAVREGARLPAFVLQAVRQVCARRRACGEDADALAVLHALEADEAGALRYAASVIAYEALPYEQRQRVKAERAFAFIKESMRGKPVTLAQAAFLRALGHTGPAPVDRAAASALIDALRQGRGEG